MSASGASHRTSEFSCTERDQIISFNRCCFGCGSLPVKAVHVVPQVDGAIDRLHSLGLLNFRIDSHMNGVALCGLCHSNFDNAYHPVFLFVPSDLGFFIEYERKDRERRLASGSTSTARQCPTAEEYRLYQIERGLIATEAHGGLYNIFVLDRDNLPLFPPDPLPPRPWHGAPLASIRRGVFALGSWCSASLPDEVKNNLRILSDLYQEGLEAPFLSSGDTSDLSSPPELDNESNMEPLGDNDGFATIPHIGTKRRSTGQGCAPPSKKPRGSLPTEKHALKPHPFEPRLKERYEPWWKWGPDFTSEQAVQSLQSCQSFSSA